MAAVAAESSDVRLWARRPDLAEAINSDGCNEDYLPGFTLPSGLVATSELGEALDGADVVMALRIQNERLAGSYFPSTREYSATFGIDRAKLQYAKDDVIVMHPGPVNRGVELSHDLADHRPSVILDQVRNGVSIRMAVLYLITGRRSAQKGVVA